MKSNTSANIPSRRSASFCGRQVSVKWRYMQGGDTGEWSKCRKRCSRAATLASQFVLRRKEIADPMSGYFMVDRALFLANVQGLCGKGFELLLDLLSTAKN